MPADCASASATIASHAATSSSGGHSGAAASAPMASTRWASSLTDVGTGISRAGTWSTPGGASMAVTTVHARSGEPVAQPRTDGHVDLGRCGKHQVDERVRLSRAVEHLGRHAGIGEPLRVVEAFVAEPVASPDHHERRRQPGQVGSRQRNDVRMVLQFGAAGVHRPHEVGVVARDDEPVVVGPGLIGRVRGRRPPDTRAPARRALVHRCRAASARAPRRGCRRRSHRRSPPGPTRPRNVPRHGRPPTA